MDPKFTEWFACAECGSPLQVEVHSSAPNNGTIAEGQLICTSCARTFPIVRSMPRFVTGEEYAHTFGYQWNRFDTLQLDRHMKNNLSRERFFATTQWPARMEGQRILEAGCGMGRFTQIALETSAEVFSFDLSNAVEANFKNNGNSPCVSIFQASIYQIPLRRDSFDKVFCMGVLQHCPDVKAAFLSLVPFLRPGGEIVIDVYQRHTGLFPPLKYLVRPLVKWMSPETLNALLRTTIPHLFEMKKALHKIPTIGPAMSRLIPIGPISHRPKLDYTDEELKEVKVLSALDMLSPVHDHPQTIADVHKWFDEAGLVDVVVTTGFNGINARGKRRPCVGPQ
jgi:SAM-dependent methyltransferase